MFKPGDRVTLTSTEYIYDKENLYETVSWQQLPALGDCGTVSSHPVISNHVMVDWDDFQARAVNVACVSLECPTTEEVQTAIQSIQRSSVHRRLLLSLRGHPHRGRNQTDAQLDQGGHP